jgi:Ca2+-binding RTX toxin-like protein
MYGRLLAVGCGAIVLGGAAPAHALTAHVDGNALVVSAATGEQNILAIQPDPAGPTAASFVIVESGTSATTHAGPGCEKTLRVIRCALPYENPGVWLSLSLGDRHDIAVVAGTQFYIEQVDAGSGNDRVDLSRVTGDGYLIGGPGNDQLNTRNGVWDSIDCGSGDDTLIADPFDVRDSC